MEKPRKKEVLPCKNCKADNSEIQDYGVGPNNPWVWYVRCCLTCGWQPEAGTTELRANENWNSTAMSTWLEGEVDELIEDLKRVDHHTVAEEIWRIQQLLRKLTGKV